MILVLGSSGYIGQAFMTELKKRGWQHACLRLDFCRVAKLYREQFVEVEEAIIRFKPELLINCYAYAPSPSVELCEDSKAETIFCNTIFPVMVNEVCRKHGVSFGHVSTGCLYPHHGHRTWTEESHPLLTLDSNSTYIGSKELAERVLGKYACYIWRIRLPFDNYDHPKNILTKFQKFECIDDQLNSFSHRGDFVSAALDIWDGTKPFGIYNIVCDGGITSREITDLLKQTICPDKEFKFFPPGEFQRNARTVKSNCVLSVEKLKSHQIPVRPVREAMLEALTHWHV